MRLRLLRVIPLLLALATGCDDSTGLDGGDVGFNDLSGDWAGEVTGDSQGFTLDAAFFLTASQDGGDLSGPWSSVGTVTGPGIGTAAVEGSGTFTGTVEPGNNPDVAATFVRPDCNDYAADFAGTYNTANQRLTMTGLYDIVDPEDDCSILLTFNTTVVIDR